MPRQKDPSKPREIPETVLVFEKDLLRKTELSRRDRGLTSLADTIHAILREHFIREEAAMPQDEAAYRNEFAMRRSM